MLCLVMGSLRANCDKSSCLVPLLPKETAVENGQDLLTNVTQAREGGNRKNLEMASSRNFASRVESEFMKCEFEPSRVGYCELRVEPS